MARAPQSPPGPKPEPPPAPPAKRLEGVARHQLEAAAWLATHPHFRGQFPDGTKTVLWLNNATGTTDLVAISSLSEAELRERVKGGPR